MLCLICMFSSHITEMMQIVNPACGGAEGQVIILSTRHGQLNFSSVIESYQSLKIGLFIPLPGI